MTNEELIELYDQFLVEDRNWLPIGEQAHIGGMIKSYTIITFDIKNDEQKVSNIPYYKVENIKQAKEIFRHFCVQFQCGGREGAFEPEFELNLSSKNFNRDKDLFLAIMHDNRTKD